MQQEKEKRRAESGPCGRITRKGVCARALRRADWPGEANWLKIHPLVWDRGLRDWRYLNLSGVEHPHQPTTWTLLDLDRTEPGARARGCIRPADLRMEMDDVESEWVSE